MPKRSQAFTGSKPNPPPKKETLSFPLKLTHETNKINFPPVYSSTSSIFPACGAVTLIPLSNLNKFISNPLQTHQVLTVLIAFLISLPFKSHFASSYISSSPTVNLFEPVDLVEEPEEFGISRRERNFSQRRRREEWGSDLKTRWSWTRERKAASIVE